MSKHGGLVPLNKIKLFVDWMKGDHVLIQIDARRDDVVVPQHLKDHQALLLKLSYLFQGKTDHDENGITSYLKFSGQYHECFVPWASIWGITSADGERVVWPEDVPGEIRSSSYVQEADQQATNAEGPPPAAEPRPKPNLTTIHSFRPRDYHPEETDPDDSGPGSSDSRRKGLTRIK